MDCSALLHNAPFPPALYRKRLREEEREKGEGREQREKGEGRREERRLGLGLLFETHQPLPLNQFLTLSNSLVVLTSKMAG